MKLRHAAALALVVMCFTCEGCVIGTGHSFTRETPNGIEHCYTPVQMTWLGGDAHETCDGHDVIVHHGN
jgi:hypothetical protein